MKKLINHPAAVVEEMVEGLVAVFPGLRRLAGQTVLVRAEIPDRTARRVAVISGGGSGHEPAHAGYVGRGMLSALHSVWPLRFPRPVPGTCSPTRQEIVRGKKRSSLAHR